MGKKVAFVCNALAPALVGVAQALPKGDPLFEALRITLYTTAGVLATAGNLELTKLKRDSDRYDKPGTEHDGHWDWTIGHRPWSPQISFSI